MIQALGEHETNWQEKIHPWRNEVLHVQRVLRPKLWLGEISFVSKYHLESTLCFSNLSLFLSLLHRIPWNAHATYTHMFTHICTCKHAKLLKAVAFGLAIDAGSLLVREKNVAAVVYYSPFDNCNICSHSDFSTASSSQLLTGCSP